MDSQKARELFREELRKSEEKEEGRVTGSAERSSGSRPSSEKNGPRST